MPFTDRRTILGAAAMLPVVAGATSGRVLAETASTEAQKPAGGPAAPPHVTRMLAQYLVSAKYDDLPANVRKEGVRTLLNWVGVAVGGSHHQRDHITGAALTPVFCPAPASPFPRRPRLDIMNAARTNGRSWHSSF